MGFGGTTIREGRPMFLVVYYDLFCAWVAWLLLERGWWPLALPFLGVSAALTSALMFCGAFALVEPWLPPEEPLVRCVYTPLGRVAGRRRVIHRPHRRHRAWGPPERP
jgi:hypothetical protein